MAGPGQAGRGGRGASTAPVPGEEDARLVDIGNLVRAGDGAPLVMMTQVRPVFVTFTLPQQYFEDVRDRQIKVPLAVRAYTSDDTRELSTGRLTLIDNTIDQLTGTIRLKAQFENDDERLWPGQFVNVRVVLDTRRAVPTVPARRKTTIVPRRRKPCIRKLRIY